MTEAEIKSKSKEELQEILINIYSQKSLLNLYFTVEGKLDMLADSFAKVVMVDVSASSRDNSTFDNMMKFFEKADLIAEKLETLKSRIDSSAFEAERRKRESAGAFSPEYFALNRKPKLRSSGREDYS